MDTKKLRQKILDLAIRGKLVPQDPNDEPASVLLERIRAEKEQLIKAGKIKRGKQTISDKPHYENVPFEMPETWEWVTLPELCAIPITDGTHQTPTYTDKDNGVPFLSSKDVTSGRINWTEIKYITKDLHDVLHKRIAPKPNDILLAKNGTTGVAARVDCSMDFDIYVTLAVIRPVKYINSKYLWYIINSPFCKEQFNSHLTGIGLPNLHLRDINKTSIPIPPQLEQKRIVEELDKWFAFIDNLESNKQDLQKYIKLIKSEILKLAITGRLVSQDIHDEPAIEVLRRINPSYNSCDTSHYENLPKGWTVCELQDVIELLDNKRKPIKSEERTKRIEGKTVLYPYYGATGFVGYIDEYLIDGRFILLGEDGAPFLDKFAEKAYAVEGKIWVNNHAHVILPKIDFEYLKLYLNAIDYHGIAKGTTRLKLTQGDMNKIPVLVPPLEEQQRISKCVQKMFEVLNAITDEL